MRVFSYNEEIINCDDDDAQIARLLAVGAEEVPIELFGDYPHLANSNNTTRVDGVWTFTLDVAEQQEADMSALAAAVRNERNRRLIACDWTQLPDSSLSEEKKQEWALSYRQPLRDVPQQEGFPNNVTWPKDPKAG
jgi:hypothetical protein